MLIDFTIHRLGDFNTKLSHVVVVYTNNFVNIVGFIVSMFCVTFEAWVLRVQCGPRYLREIGVHAQNVITILSPILNIIGGTYMIT